LRPTIPFRTNEEIRAAAELFLEERNRTGQIPVPIEEIIEFDLGLEIVPVRGLQERFGIEGYLSTDLASIYVDERVMQQVPVRYRFTLAHELAHRVLHPQIVSAAAVEDPEEWKESIRSLLSPEHYARVEYQAYEFAGCLLVPRVPLLGAFQGAAERAERYGVKLDLLSDASISRVAGSIAKQFQVSTQVVERRLKREGVWRQEE
jgi:Zn-dependent peptidase ImmA (M78 family)